MKNLKFLSFALLLCVLVIAGCEKVNNQEKLSCDGEDVCPIETPSIEIEENPTVIVEANDEGDLNGNGGETRENEGNLEGDLSLYEGDDVVLEGNEQTVEESADQPMMKIMVDEGATPEEIEITQSQTCEALGGTWNEGDCTLQDGSKVYF